MLLAASLHGPGTPGVSTTRSPDIARARSTSTYSAMAVLSPAVILAWGDRASRPRRVPSPRWASDTGAARSRQVRRGEKKEKGKAAESAIARDGIDDRLPSASS